MAGSVELECLLVADDLTGACDAAAPFAVHGLETRVVVSPGADTAGATVVAVSTESRDLPGLEVRAAMRRAAAGLNAGSIRVVFKKIDSTLRGNTSVEIAAALEEFQCRAAVVCPAFPAMHRVVEEGHLKVSTAPEFAPVHMATHLGCYHCTAEDLREGLARGERIVSLDAVCDADLDGIAAEILELEGPILWAGSAGLASALARRMGAVARQGLAAPEAGAVLFCIGSDHAVTLAQERELVACRRTVQAGSTVSIAEAIRRGEHVLLPIPRGRVSVEELRQRMAGVRATALVLSGGDTASLVCRAAGVRTIELCGEIDPGIPLGTLRGGDFDGVSVVTKSGGFGDCNALIRITDYFSCPNQ